MKILNTDIQISFEKLKNQFESHFGNTKEVAYYLSPASIILLGDHTHYNDGMLISTAIDRYSLIAARKRNDNQIHILFNNNDISFELMNNHQAFKESHWLLLSVQKIISFFKEENKISSGFELGMSFGVPKCIGLGAYASIQIGIIKALNDLFDWKLNEDEIVSISRKIELNLIGKISNTAHHYTASISKKENLIFIDLRTLGHKNLTFPNDEYSIVICDTGIEIENPEKLCNERIEECEVGVKGLRLYIWGIKNLRDVKHDFLQKHIKMIPQRVFKRCQYNVQERIRVENAVKYLKGKDYLNFGKQIFDSHSSLANDYQLSCEELDFLVEKTKNIDGALGAKMISCTPLHSTLNIVKKNCLDDFVNKIESVYRDKYKNDLNIHILNFSTGIKNISRVLI